MQTIPNQYKQAGYLMELQVRDGMVAVYKALLDDYWEVHIVRVEKARMAFGKPYPEHEALASSSEFGRWAWACTSQARADIRRANAQAILALAGQAQGESGRAGEGPETTQAAQP